MRTPARTAIVTPWIRCTVSALVLAATTCVAAAVDVVAPARERHLAPLPDGTFLLCGGWNGSATLTESYRFDPAANTWTPVQALSVGREAYSATSLLDGKVLVVGGYI